MVLTNFGAPNIKDQVWDAYQSSMTGFWIKIISSWVACTFYLWILVRPSIFRSKAYEI